MRNTEKRGRFSELLKIFSDKLHGKETPKKIDTSKMSEECFCNLVLVELGGLENLLVIDSCITRLRIEVKDISKINSEKLQALGSEGVIQVGENRLQIIFGEKAAILEKYYNKLKKEIEEKAKKMEEKLN
ncbi:glucose PTS transporter subunit EIIB [Fusobacterium sp.]|uniref:glucose PTS transporter subunit EIIB n=1 Tax=Fusobacterium sp. TaxID=68766 RepID=UPI00262FD6CF|nr:glucose PTS transporter subunit EIIB [Fusobacterium sp.]